MGSIEEQANILRLLVQEWKHQMQGVECAAMNGPHLDLNLQELRVVEYLGAQGPRMMRELSEYLSVAVNSVTSIVDNMERKSLVRRQRSETDRRVVHVELTDEGRAIFESSNEIHLRMFRSMLSALEESERDVFINLFRKIAGAGAKQEREIALAEK